MRPRQFIHSSCDRRISLMSGTCGAHRTPLQLVHGLKVCDKLPELLIGEPGPGWHARSEVSVLNECMQRVGRGRTHKLSKRRRALCSLRCWTMALGAMSREKLLSGRAGRIVVLEWIFGWTLGAALRINGRNEEDDYRNDLNRMSSHYRFLRNIFRTCCPKPENSCDTPKRTSVE